MTKKIDISGKEIGGWFVIGDHDRVNPTNYRMLCRCLCGCGEQRPIYKAKLLGGNPPRCAQTRAQDRANGVQTARTRNFWHSLRHNGELPDEWLDFEKFYSDMGASPDGQKLARHDRSKPHSKENSFWNSTNGRMVTIDGETKNIAEWARAAAVSQEAIRKRLKRGLTGRDIIAPRQWRKGKEPQPIEINGEFKTAGEWAKASGVNAYTIKNRHGRGVRGDALLAAPAKKEQGPKKAREKKAPPKKAWLSYRELRAMAGEAA